MGTRMLSWKSLFSVMSELLDLTWFTNHFHHISFEMPFFDDDALAPNLLKIILTESQELQLNFPVSS